MEPDSEFTGENTIVEQDLAAAMRGALDEGQFTIFLQPQFNPHTNTLMGAEALVRWNHPQRGLVPPPEFIPIMERSGLIRELDSYVFEQVCEFIRQQADHMGNIVPISVNLSRYDVFSAGFVDKLESIREKYGIPARYIRIELSENAMLGGHSIVNDVLAKFHEYGYLIEMDDFGSGYASLNVLKEIDFDIIKIDMKFFHKDNSKHGKRTGIILSSIVNMLNQLQIPVIAEGVETEEQANFLGTLGCYCMQGFLFSRPLPIEDFRLMLEA